MNKRTVLSGIASLLLVAGFYTFTFCLVGDVDDEPIPMELYYSTETNADTGEDIGEATSVIISDYDKMSEIVTKHEVVTTVPEYTEPISLPTGKLAETAVEEDINENKNVAENKNVFAENKDDELSKIGSDEYNDKADETEEPEENEETDALIENDDSDEILLDDEQSEPETQGVNIEIDDIAPVSADVVVTIDTAPTEETTAETTAAETAADAAVPAESEVFTAKYNGYVHNDDAYDLVCRIVNNEISAYFSDEAIKAQAVAAYSYVKYHNVNGLTPSVLVKDNVPEKIKKLVASVWGKCCYYNGKVAQTVYMASSSGYTASSENVWGGSIPYLVSVECPFDAQNDPNYGKQVKFAETDIRSSLENYLGITLSDDPSNWFRITGYVDGNYVSTVSVDGQKTISGRKLRENVLSYRLNSASFDISYSDGYFTFTTYGWGHGVGMSQNGANYLAKTGYTYDQILKYYYTGIDVL